MNLSNLNDRQKDALKELGNIGAAHAATALSQMLGQKIQMTVPQVNFVNKSQIENSEKSIDKMGVSIYTDVYGKIKGKILVYFEYQNALDLVKLLIQNDNITSISEIEESALKEIGNILSSSYLNAISTLIDGVLLPSIPSISLDSLSGTLSFFAKGFNGVIQNALWIKTELKSESSTIVGDFFLFPEDASLNVIFEAMNV